MPLGAPIGSGLGIQNRVTIRSIVEGASVPVLFFFFLMIRRAPGSTLFPYTTLFRSEPLSEFLLRRRLERAARLLCNEYYAQHTRSEEHTSELQSPCNIVCRLQLEKKKKSVLRVANCDGHTVTIRPRILQAI